MTAFAINVLALIIVLGLCWFAMMWLSGRSHGHGDVGGSAMGNSSVGTGQRGQESCASCDGVGARSAAGRVSPCPACLGTGLLS